MSEVGPEVVLGDFSNEKKISVEIGVGHMPGISILDRLKDTSKIESGEVLHVSVDEESANLEHVSLGAVSRMDMATFAQSDFLDGKVSTMYIFNVFGEPYSSASIAGFSKMTLEGLKKKLKPGGQIVIGEHITPERAHFLRDTRQLQSMAFLTELYDSPIAIAALLTKRFGLSEEYARAFIGQSEENRQWKGKSYAGFLLILKKSKDIQY